MEKEEKLHEKKRMDGRVEKEDEEDWKATLWYDLEKEMKQIFEEVTRKKQTVTRDFTRELWAIEQKYKEAGLSLEEIEKARSGIANGK